MEIEPGDFFYHIEYKTGHVLSVSHDTPSVVEIQFFNRSLDRLSSRLLETSSTKVSPEGFRAFAYQDRESAEKLITDNPVQVILLTLTDFDQSYTKTEKVKDYLVPDFIKLADWENWWKATQHLLKDDPRIDTTRSRKREYAIAKEQYSRAETDYVRFRANRHLFSQERLAELARSALNQQNEDSLLSIEHAAELTDYLNNVIFLDRYPIHLRLETLIHMYEDKLITPEEYHSRLDRLLLADIRLYDLGIIAARGVIDELLDSHLGEHELKILATGICSDKTIGEQIIRWAQQKQNSDFIALLLITAFRENLSSTGSDTFYQRLMCRLESCCLLVDYLLDNDHAWPEIFEAFSDITRSLAAAKPKELDVVIPTFIKLASELERRASKIRVDLVGIFLKGIVGPELPIEFSLVVLDACTKNPNAIQLTEKVRDFLWSSAEQRRDDLLTPLIGSIDDAPMERAGKMVSIIEKYSYQSLINRAAELICAYCQKVTSQETLQLLPSLDYLHGIKGEFAWRPKLEHFRENAYLAMFQAVPSINSIQDPSIIQAAERFAQLQGQNLLAEREELRKKNNKLETYVEDLNRQLKDNDVKMRELISIQRGDDAGIRFDERIRILRELADISSEYEAFTFDQPGDHRELAALIKGILNILIKNKVQPMDEIGTQVVFTSAKHRLIDSTYVANGEFVTVIERGFLIKDPKDQTRLLKPALVRK